MNNIGVTFTEDKRIELQSHSLDVATATTAAAAAASVIAVHCLTTWTERA